MMSGLKFLINFHRLCGISYSGVSLTEKKESIFKRIFIIVWNLLIVLLSIWCSFKFTNSLDYYNNEITLNKSVVLFITSRISGVLYFTQLYISNFMFLIIGGKLIKLLRQITISLEGDTDKNKIGLWVAFAQISINIFNLVFSFAMLGLNIEKTFQFEDILSILVCFILLINQSSFLAIIAFDSKLIEKYFKNIIRGKKFVKLPQILQKLCTIKEHVKHLDDLVSFQIFVMIITNIALEINLICVLSIDFNKGFNYAIAGIICAFLLLIILCYVCNILPKIIAEFYDFMEKIMAQSNQTSLYIHYIPLLLNMKEEIGFTALGLVKIRASTFLSILALIISYTVILIQTSGAENQSLAKQ
jgi:hypothetical protein